MQEGAASLLYTIITFFPASIHHYYDRVSLFSLRDFGLSIIVSNMQTYEHEYVVTPHISLYLSHRHASDTVGYVSDIEV